MEKGLNTLMNLSRTAVRKRDNGNSYDNGADYHDMDNFNDSAIGRELTPGYEMSIEDRRRNVSGTGRHDQQPSRMASRAASIEYMNTPQQLGESLASITRFPKTILQF